MMNKKSYDAAFEMIRSQRNMENKLDGIGFDFEYGLGIVGSHFNTILTNCEVIIKESMGLHSVSKEGTCLICGTNYPITIDILYTEEENEDFSMTGDDFCEFCYNVVYDSENGATLQELAWKALAEKNAEAKEEFNKMAKQLMIGPMPK